MTYDSGYWMNQVLVRSQEVARLRAAAIKGRVPWWEVKDASDKLRYAMKKYTNPFGLKKGTTA